MNKIYRLIWSAIAQMWIVVSELTASRGKQKNARKKLILQVTALVAGLYGFSVSATVYTSPVQGDFTFTDASTVTTSGDNTPALSVNAGELITATDALTLETSGINSYGVITNSGGTINIADLNITTTGDNGFGLVTNGSGGTITSSGTTRVQTSGISGYGVYSNGGNINLSAADITTTGDTSYGIMANSGTIEITGSTTVNTSGYQTYGINAQNGGALNLSQIDLDINGTAGYSIGILSQGNGSAITSSGFTTVNTHNAKFALSAVKGGQINLSGLDVTTESAIALDAEGGSTITNTGSTAIHLIGNTSAIVAKNSVINLSALNITSSGDNGGGIVADNSSTVSVTGPTVIKQTGDSGLGVFAAGGSKVNVQDLSITNRAGNYNIGIGITDTNTTMTDSGNTSIDIAGTDGYGVYVGGGATANFARLAVTATGDNTIGMTLGDPGSQINLTDTTVSTSGLASHGFQVTGGASKTFDGAAGNILPLITVEGAGSALLDASDAGSQIHLVNQVLNVGQTNGTDTWGGKAENGATISLEGTTRSGGTGLWASGSVSQLLLTGTTDTTGSRVKLDDGSSLTLSRADNTATVGSLEGSTTSTVRSVTADGNLTTGVNNAAGNGSMVDNADFGGAFSNIGQLIKAGPLTQILSGSGNTVGRVDVTGGTLQFRQAGAFTTTGDYATRNGATTDIGLAASTLNAGGAFTQNSGSGLRVTIGATPDITADTASLDGYLTINGFTEGPVPVKASDVAGSTYTVIHTANGITGDFVNNPLTSSGLDYLLSDGHLSTDRKDYNLGFRMAWNEGLQDKSNGSFTVNAGTAFDIDTVLADQTVPVGGFTTGWDGTSLTKAGEGLLVLSAVNTYSGDTTLSAGTLRAGVADTIADGHALTISGGVFDLNGYSQQVNRLGGTGGEVDLSGATLTAVNTTGSDNTTFAGDIMDGSMAGGRLSKTGAGTLTLSGKTGWTGNTRIDGGELVLDGIRGGAQLVSNITGADNTMLTLKNGAGLTGTIDPTDVSIDAASHWNMTGDSVVSTVNLAGTLNIVAPAATPMSAGRTLTTGNWNGQDGTVVLNTVLGDDTSVTDRIVVNGITSGNTFIKVNNAGGHGAQTVEGIQVVKVNGQSDGTFTREGRITAGAYDYSLLKKGGDWYLTSQYVKPAYPVTKPQPQDKKVIRMLRPEAGSYTANLAAANTLFITRLHDRLGETQYTDILTGEKKVTSLWLRQAGGHNAWTDGSGQLDTQSNRYVIQMGGEIAQWSGDGLQRLHLGIMGGYGHNSSSTLSDVTGYRSEGSVDGYSAGVYATWYDNDETHQGMYADSWAQYGWFNNHVKGEGLQEENYKSGGMTASVETGYTHKLGEFSGSLGSLNEWYIQPQVQAVWMGVVADDHREHNGTRVSGEGDGNLQTRLGVRTFLKGHHRVDDGKDRTFEPFVEVNWIHNTNDFGANMDGMNVHQTGARDIGEIKTGVEGQLSKRVNLWGNVGVQVGGKGYNDTAAMIGVKYSF